MTEDNGFDIFRVGLVFFLSHLAAKHDKNEPFEVLTNIQLFFCCVWSDGPTTKTNSSYKLAFDTFEKELCDVNYNLLINNSFTLDGLNKKSKIFLM